MRKVIRIEIETAPVSAPPKLYYLVIERHEVTLFNVTGGKLRLSVIAAAKAAVLRFVLEDAPTAAFAIKNLKRVLPNIKARELKLP